MKGGAKLGEHKFHKNHTYYTVCIYVTITVIILAVAIKAIWCWASTLHTLSKILYMLSPFLIGVFIAYLINPLVKLIDKYIFIKIFKIKKGAIRKGLSILISYIVVFGVIAFCISVIIPEIYSSLKNIYGNVQDEYDKFLNFLEDLSNKHPDWDISYIINVAKENSSNIIDFIKGSLDKVLPLIYNTSISVISWTIKVIIAIIVSCYMLIDKDRLLLSIKKLIYVFFKEEKAKNIVSTCKECNKIFGNFLIGKSIDSAIIGCMCFVFMNMLHLKYSMLISVIVGVTNMIPYFGPFIGAAPGVLLLLTVNWRYALIFGVLIFVLQQFDGLYLGPKILGESTGLRPVWIIFAITAGGWLCGPIGMFLGVPVVAVIAYLIDKIVSRKLADKNLSFELPNHDLEFKNEKKKK